MNARCIRTSNFCELNDSVLADPRLPSTPSDVCPLCTESLLGFDFKVTTSSQSDTVVLTAVESSDSELISTTVITNAFASYPLTNFDYIIMAMFNIMIPKIACTACTSAGLSHSCQVMVNERTCKRCLENQGHCSFRTDTESYLKALIQLSRQQFSFMKAIVKRAEDIERVASQELREPDLNWYYRILHAQMADRTNSDSSPLVSLGCNSTNHKFIVYIL
ncbi:hypothetical protein PSTG_07351 [Puccinia striiformis f. sp. tritici PST-78]|uniref:Uncharacterized protein n=2 Tax=Puccinia striiformis f. sp. tritici TaxID=168172 RepID=A0A0L0VJH5_9BASI|nr:hypothetical protein PSTG_07351 [Puccinia striiformis f. sp. tritici PST-78]